MSRAVRWALPVVVAMALPTLAACSGESDPCQWESPALDGAGAVPPDGTQGAIEDVLPGSWQLVQIDDGTGFAPPAYDGRYVFTADSVILCQDSGDGEPELYEADYEVDGPNLRFSIMPYPLRLDAWDADRLLWTTSGGDGTAMFFVRRS